MYNMAILDPLAAIVNGKRGCRGLTLPIGGHKLYAMAPKKNAAAVALSKLAAKARMKKLTPEQRSEYARNAAMARWFKVKKPKAGRPVR